MKRILLCIIASAITLMSFSQNQVLQIFENLEYNPIQWKDITDFEIEENEHNFELNIKTIEDHSISLQYNDSLVFQTGLSIPHLEITTDEDIEEIPDKINYKTAKFVVHGFGTFEDVDSDVSIRGRGNTSWEFDKKPYRLKFDKKISLCGLPKAKNYVLLANYTDASLMQFAVATKIARMLGMPYTNNVVPVDVTLNGIYKGAYILTNKPGINAGSVDIDESNSIMWELDINYDEDWKFKSEIYQLPVMAVDPDMNDELFEKWKKDFNEMEKAAVELNASDYVDLDLFARYLLVYEIVSNGEIGWPKSVKLFKTEGEKYKFGPVWDFDVACGYVWSTGEAYTTTNIEKPVWINPLFDDFIHEEEFKKTIKNHWEFIKANKSEIFDFIDTYAAQIRNSAHRNQKRWSNYDDWDVSIEKLKNYLELRFLAVDNFEMLK